MPSWGGIVLILAALSCAFAAHPENDMEAAVWEAIRQTEGIKGMSDQDLLHWAITHSDPEALKEEAKNARHPERASDLAQRQHQVAQLLDAVRHQPTEKELMAEAIAVLTNETATQQSQQNALKALQLLVEPLDNANDLDKLGGVAPVVRLLGSPSAALRAGAAYVLGTAASNNEPFQAQLMARHPEAIPALMALISASAHEHRAEQQQQQQQQQAAREAGAERCASMGLYAMAAVLRTNEAARAVFYGSGGMAALQALLLDGGEARGVRRKALNLIADLVQLDGGALSAGGSTALNHSATAQAMAQLLRPAAGQQGVGSQQQGQGASSEDLDMEEKAVLAVLAVLENHGGAISGGVLQGLGTALDGLAERLNAALAAVPAADGGQGSEEGEYERDVLALVGQAQAAVAAQREQRARAEL